MQIFTPNHSKHNCDVTSTNFNPVKLRNEKICPEPSTVDKALKQKHVKQLYRYTVQVFLTLPGEQITRA